MNEIEFPTTVVDFLREAGRELAPVQGRDGTLVYDSENGLLLRRDIEEFVVEEFSRGVVGRVLLRTEERDAVIRYVVLNSAPAWRSRAGLPFLYTMLGPSDLPDGYEVRKDSPRRFTVVWSQDGRWCRAEELDMGYVTEFVRSLPHSLADVIASLKNPDGEPAFPQTP